MRCISLWQPWASLVRADEGFKTIETRSWQTSYRGPLALHASKKMDGELRRQCLQEPFLTMLKRAGFLSAKELPLGAVVAVCRLVDVVPTEWVTCDPLLTRRFQKGDSGRVYIPFNEARFGNYANGRFAWLLDDIRVLDTPLPCNGAQGLFEVNLQEEVTT